MQNRFNDNLRQRDVHGDASSPRSSDPSYHLEREIRGSSLTPPETQSIEMQAAMRAAQRTLAEVLSPTGRTIHHYKDNPVQSLVIEPPNIASSHELPRVGRTIYTPEHPDTSTHDNSTRPDEDIDTVYRSGPYKGIYEQLQESTRADIHAAYEVHKQLRETSSKNKSFKDMCKKIQSMGIEEAWYTSEKWINDNTAQGSPERTRRAEERNRIFKSRLQSLQD